jgi:hypothetical protein
MEMAHAPEVSRAGLFRCVSGYPPLSERLDTGQSRTRVKSRRPEPSVAWHCVLGDSAVLASLAMKRLSA